MTIRSHDVGEAHSAKNTVPVPGMATGNTAAPNLELKISVSDHGVRPWGRSDHRVRVHDRFRRRLQPADAPLLRADLDPVLDASL